MYQFGNMKINVRNVNAIGEIYTDDIPSQYFIIVYLIGSQITCRFDMTKADVKKEIEKLEYIIDTINAK